MEIIQADIDRDGGLVDVVAVPPGLAYDIWPDVEEYATAALTHAYDGMTEEYILTRIIEGRLLLVLMTMGDKICAAATLEIATNKKGRALHCLTMGGENMDGWIHDYMQVWKRIAKENGCKYLTFKGREGWARYARRLGFEHQYTQMVLKL